MAKIWPVYEGTMPTFIAPWASLPVSEAIALFELRPDDFVSGLAKPPRIGDVDSDLRLLGFKHIVVEVKRSEGRKAQWKPGFYRSRIKPKEAFDILIQQALAAKLGNENVVRVVSEPTTDSQGREALKITVVIAPTAAQDLEREAVLDALVSLKERLREMREDRVPIIEYATEAELE